MLEIEICLEHVFVERLNMNFDQAKALYKKSEFTGLRNVFQKLIDHGIIDAKYFLARMLIWGQDGPEDKEAGLKIMEQYAEYGIANEINYRGSSSIILENEPLILQAKESNDLGQIVSSGCDYWENEIGDDIARDLFAYAAERGDWDGLNNLCTDEEQSYEDQIKWLKKGMEFGHSRSRMRLLRILLTGPEPYHDSYAAYQLLSDSPLEEYEHDDAIIICAKLIFEKSRDYGSLQQLGLDLLATLAGDSLNPDFKCNDTSPSLIAIMLCEYALQLGLGSSTRTVYRRITTIREQWFKNIYFKQYKGDKVNYRHNYDPYPDLIDAFWYGQGVASSI